MAPSAKPPMTPAATAPPHPPRQPLPPQRPRHCASTAMCAVADFKAAALDKTGAAEAESAIDSSNAPAKPAVIVRWIKLDLLMIISFLAFAGPKTISRT